MSSTLLGLLIGTLTYFVSSLGSIAIVKFLNYRLCFQSWVLVALLSCSTWVLSGPLHWGLTFREDVSLGMTWKQLRLYFFIAIGLSVVELLNSLAMSVLPGSWYAFLKGSDVGFSMILSHWMLGKSYHWGQIVGAGFVMGGIGMVFALGSLTAPIDDDRTVSLLVASLLCLCGAYLNSACAVIIEATLKQTLHEEEIRTLVHVDHAPPSKLLLSNAYFLWTSFLSFLLLIIPSILSGQLQGVFQETDEQAEVCHGMDISTKNVNTILISMFVLLVVSRFGERLSKHWICVYDSAVTFHLVQAARRLSAVFLLAALFQEAFPPSMVVGSFCSAIGFAMHFLYGRVNEGIELLIPAAAHEYELVASTAEDLHSTSGQHNGIHKE